MNETMLGGGSSQTYAGATKGVWTDTDENRWLGVLDQVGTLGMRFALVAVIAWIGAMKFTSYEAEAISGLVANSPLLGWAYAALSHRQFSAVLGVAELAIAGLLTVGPYNVWCGRIGAAGAVGMFLTTLSFMATTPGVFEPAAGGFPALSAKPGQFLVKDVALLAISVRLLIEAFRSKNQR